MLQCTEYCVCDRSENCKNQFTAVHFMESDSSITFEDHITDSYNDAVYLNDDIGLAYANYL